MDKIDLIHNLKHKKFNFTKLKDEKKIKKKKPKIKTKIEKIHKKIEIEKKKSLKNLKPIKNKS